VELYPNSALVNGQLGTALCDAGQLDEGITYMKKGIRLNPFPPYYYYKNLGECYLQKGQYEDASIEFKKALQRAPEAPEVHGLLSVNYVLLDRLQEARASAAKCMELAPRVSVSLISKVTTVKNKAYLNIALEAMRKAEFPE
jgi:adenylate cyclase